MQPLLGPQTGCLVTRQVCHCRPGIGFQDDKPTIGLNGVKIKNHVSDFSWHSFSDVLFLWARLVRVNFFSMHCEPKAIELPQPDGSTSSSLEVRSFCVPQCPVRKLLGVGDPPICIHCYINNNPATGQKICPSGGGGAFLSSFPPSFD